MKQSSYQKLKSKCEYLQSQVDIFKNALTIRQKYEKSGETYDKDGNLYLNFKIYYHIKKNKIDEEAKTKLQFWVAENLDKESIMYLLSLKDKHNE